MPNWAFLGVEIGVFEAAEQFAWAIPNLSCFIWLINAIIAIYGRTQYLVFLFFGSYAIKRLKVEVFYTDEQLPTVAFEINCFIYMIVSPS